ncbi:TIGR00701 family protein [Bosea vaviloviae]|uniref:Protoporphyrinogen IX oxidase n=2 Tax=Bosea vaviloviae TaxID=1526658 RepID=A0A1D7TXK9_9HYPH|nr:protoporphyrinogen oxidase HemJ [Bosea vaviloviae]AOO79860.1 TIGR00701 family protein [Bosea vaviloviae]
MYEWIKAFHVMAVIAWMASMLYLPRLMVYHAEAQTGSIQSETFKIMERRLLKGIMTPSMIVTWILGLYLAWSAFGFKGGWLHGKILLVFILSAIHGYLAGRVRAFAEDRNLKSARFYRVINEVPAVLMALIVILVIVKPF